MPKEAKPRRQQMTLFVWENVLCDYTPGMAVILAPSLKAALELARASHLEDELSAVQPEQVPVGLAEGPPRLWQVHGGG